VIVYEFVDDALRHKMIALKGVRVWMMQWDSR
jgi:hypothetical protein